MGLTPEPTRRNEENEECTAMKRGVRKGELTNQRDGDINLFGGHGPGSKGTGEVAHN